MAFYPKQLIYQKMVTFQHMFSLNSQHQQLVHRLMSLFSFERMQTDWSPLPREVYEGLDSCADALSVLRRAEKLGKIVVTVPFRMVTDGAGTYVLSGGTGALGLCVSRRLIEEGANVPWFLKFQKPLGFVIPGTHGEKVCKHICTITEKIGWSEHPPTNIAHLPRRFSRWSSFLSTVVTVC